MILQQLQVYLCTHPATSLEALAQHFHTDANALRGMLDLLIRKGRVRKLRIQPCGNCHSCDPESLELYEWIHSPDAYQQPTVLLERLSPSSPES